MTDPRLTVLPSGPGTLAVLGLVVKTLVVALLTLPVMAYVTGSMVGARSELPAQRDPVVIGNRMDVEPQQTIGSEPTRPRPDDGRDDGSDDDTVSVVRPQPRDIDDDADDRDDGPDDDSRDDDSGDDDD